MRFVGIPFFTGTLQRRHPRRRQMTVLQHHPRAILDGAFHHFQRNGSLTLAERQRVEFRPSETLHVGELEEGSRRVGSWRQDEDERSETSAVGERTAEVERRWFDELFADIVDNEFVNCRHDLDEKKNKKFDFVEKRFIKT